MEASKTRPVCVIAICTYKRPQLLRSLMDELCKQDFYKLDVEPHILIVDNDPALSARAVFDDLNARSKDVIMHYRGVQPQGLVVGRNAALDFAKSLDAVVVFIDDDELPSVKWFTALWEMHLTFPDDVIAGPVVPRFELPPPSWCEDGSYWERPTHKDAVLLSAPTGDGNILYPLKLVRNWRYSLRYNTSGAQDTHLLKRWLSSGLGLRWSAHAVVTEIVPAGRLTFAYALDRAYFSSLAYVWVDREFGASAAWTLLRAGRRLCIGAVDFTLSILRRDAWRFHRARLHVASAKGTIHGLKFKDFDRYSRYQIDASTTA